MYHVLMNLTVSIDDEVLKRARELARKRGMSLQQLLREYLESLVGGPPGEHLAERLFAIMDESPGRSGGLRIRREEAHEGRA